jgi:F-type H+-transporting ATPase subunit delta
MDIRTVSIAKKYAQAFLNVFEQTISPADFDQLCLLGQFLNAHKRALFFLGLPHIPLDEKVRTVTAMINRYKLPVSLSKLFTLLIEDGRSLLMGEVMNQVCEEYRIRNNIQTFAITSSHTLKQEELADIKSLLEHATKTKVVYSYKLDKKLVAGLRLQSATSLWEYSIEKQLRNFARAVHR